MREDDIKTKVKMLETERYITLSKSSPLCVKKTNVLQKIKEYAISSHLTSADFFL